MTVIEQKILNTKESRIIITENIEEADLITHNGTFHSDEVFSTVLLSKVLKKDILKLCRTSNIKEGITGFIYDVGYGKYDHHQPGGNGERKNGIKYSSFGLVWRDFGRDFLKQLNCPQIEEVWAMVDKKLVQNIDAVDNGQLGKLTQFDFEVVTLPNLISMYNSNWDDEQANQDEMFLKAVHFAQTVFDRFIISVVSKIKAKSGVEDAIEKSENQILILEKFMPWKEFLLDSESENAKDILFVVFPSNRGGYNVYAVPKEKESFESRKLFPIEWAGLKDEELQKATGVATATFCHTNRFICATKTKEDAIKIANIAVKA